MSQSRIEPVAVALNGKMFAIGGSDNNGPSGALEEYDPATDTWVTRASMPTARFGFAAVVNNGHIYAMGGFDNHNALDTVEEYDPATNSWSTKANMSTVRMLLGAADSGGKIYAIGGSTNIYNPSTGNVVALNSVEEYDPTTDTWTPKASMSSPRVDFSVSVDSSGSIYSIGGKDLSSPNDPATQLNSVEKYDPSTDSWANKASMSIPREQLTTVTANGEIYAIGGVSGFTILDLVEVYDPLTDTWTTQTSLPAPLTAMGGTATDNYHMYLVKSDILYEGTLSLPITTLEPIADSYIKQGSSNENEGVSTFLRIQQTGHNRALVKFNESQIQAAIGNSQNYTAKLQLTITDNGNNWGANGRSIALHRLNSDWVEGNGFIDGNSPSNRGAGSGVTWNCSIDANITNSNDNCSGSNAWSMTNASQWPFISSPTQTAVITNNQSGVVEFNVTSDVQSFINGSNQNYGWLLKKVLEEQPGKVLFGSKETSNSPKLVISIN